jgi:hypothetical protein
MHEYPLSMLKDAHVKVPLVRVGGLCEGLSEGLSEGLNEGSSEVKG